MLSAELAKRLRDAGVECTEDCELEGFSSQAALDLYCKACKNPTYTLSQLLEEVEKRGYPSRHLECNIFTGAQWLWEFGYARQYLDDKRRMKWVDPQDSAENAVALALLSIVEEG
ncbi:MAG: hypothetical protein M0R06_10570 [Sphaerochaeta sp.]|jgi:hypothetical protein|nr:hypothetical protein [Sphaerochaeta sp.]